MNIAVSIGDALGPPSETPPRVRVWVLLGDGAGDNAQLLRLAEALGWRFEAKRVSLQPAQSVPEPAARCLEAHRGYSSASIRLAPPWSTW